MGLGAATAARGAEVVATGIGLGGGGAITVGSGSAAEEDAGSVACTGAATDATEVAVESTAASVGVTAADLSGSAPDCAASRAATMPNITEVDVPSVIFLAFAAGWGRRRFIAHLSAPQCGELESFVSATDPIGRFLTEDHQSWLEYVSVPGMVRRKGPAQPTRPTEPVGM